MRKLGLTLIAVGVALYFLPTLFIRIQDAYISFVRVQEAAEWIERHEIPISQPAPPQKEVKVVKPGDEGYLLEIPKLGLRIVVRELEPTVFSGKNTPLLKRYGIGQVPYTEGLKNVSPGGDGTAAIAGHRTTSGAPFRNIHLLDPGDEILIRQREILQKWEVVYSITVVPSQVEAIKSRAGTKRLVLLACNPPFSAKERIIVYAKLIEGGE
jgi:sortase A